MHWQETLDVLAGMHAARVLELNAAIHVRGCTRAPRCSALRMTRVCRAGSRTGDARAVQRGAGTGASDRGMCRRALPPAARRCRTHVGRCACAQALERSMAGASRPADVLLTGELAHHVSSAASEGYASTRRSVAARAARVSSAHASRCAQPAMPAGGGGAECAAAVGPASPSLVEKQRVRRAAGRYGAATSTRQRAWPSAPMDTAVQGVVQQGGGPAGREAAGAS